jgi:hypothetical protein
MFVIKKLSGGRFVFAAIAATVILASPARADYPEYVKKACKSDFKKYCPRYDINSKSLRACMKAVADDLTPRCVEALERNGERRGK